MPNTTILLLIILWFLSGAASFMYWHTKLLDFTNDDILIACVFTAAGLLSVIAVPLAYYLFTSESTKPVVLIKRRK